MELFFVRLASGGGGDGDGSVDGNGGGGDGVLAGIRNEISSPNGSKGVG
jgi:hypothetical protein